MLVSGLILGLFAVIGTTLVGITFQATSEQIADNERLALLRKLNQILPSEKYDNDLLHTTINIEADHRLGQDKTSTIYIAKRQNEVSAMIFSVIAPKGYSGEIKMLVGINIDGTLAGVRIVSHKETPGLGDAMETEKSDWVYAFNGKSLHSPAEKQWKVKRDGGVFDQFTGATITPRAVVQAVHLCLVYFDRHKKELLAQYESQTPSPTPENKTNDTEKSQINLHINEVNA
ncbi:MAG: electron transport complex subunit RsxG [endosymbiont of Galathealinum brachiosum]|uniref:Ion-translocating oxidoreductase complex subunit G n=1 Tax=endosymbiont of Galathealinum brachiosum TaxID=2200906 RepID=A0A370D9Z7_9GAMM|nr:MAG: electron transport complex subunit RsxG [endosymbiont of Galathealinum brachiosum]